MDIPEQDKQALIEAARRRSQPKEGGAAFGIYPSSGKRPERLNVSRDVNMPAQAARGWVAGTLGLLGDFESIGRAGINFAFGPGGVNVDETPVLPTSEFYQEYLPGGDERPAAKFASGLGALAGGAGSTKLAGAAVKGAKATGKALGPKAAEMAESYLQRSGLAPTVVKPKGGNWLSGSVEGATERLKTIQLDEGNNLITPESVTPEMVSRNPDLAVNNWIDTKLNKYIRNEMGTPEDPVRKLAERDVLHVAPEQLNFRPEMHGRYLAEGQTAVAQSPTAKTWEGAADLMIAPAKAGELLSKDTWLADLPQYQKPLEDNPWLAKVSPETSVYALSTEGGRPTVGRDLGFDHLIDELRNATRADSDLPANLRWKPEDLKKVTMEQAVERVAKINDWRAAQMEAAKKAAREGIPIHKEYEGGFQWMAAPDTAKDPKSLKYIQDVGCESGWCTQGESLARQYGGGGNQLYVLHDPNGKSVVQISVRPQAAKQGFVGNQRPSEADYYRLQEEWLEGNRVGTIDPNLTFAQWWRAKEGIPEPDLPPEIVEIKGKQNRAPKEEHLPMVQDFVRSGNWSRVGDFKNTGFDFPATGPQGIFDLGDIQRLNKAGIDVPKYLTRDEAKRLQDKLYEIDTGKNPETGYAKGGLVEDTDAIAAKLTGMDKDKALTHALRMANAKQEAHMQAGGLATLFKGAKAAKAAKAAEEAAAAAKAAKVAKPVEKAAPVLPVAPRAQALEKARKNAIKAGQSPKEAERMLQQGYEPDWYHGTTGDIKALERERLGQATGAESAKKAFFFVRDPSTPPPEMLEKTRDPKSLEMMKKLGFSDEELAKLNEVSMKGHGAETASGYSQIGGSREYNEAMRKANAAERAGKWSEYEKWMQVAEDSEIGRMESAQDLVAKYGEARDVMLDRINNAVLNKPLPQQEAQALDAKMKELMPYGWYNSYSIPQLKALKGEIVKLAGPEAAAPALQSIDDFISVKANRMLEETYQEGSNVMPVALRYKNPMYYDFGGSTYRDQSYSDLIDQARAGGHDALIIKNTFDPGAGPAKLVDIGAVFKPEQVRSRFAAFDPARINENDILGAADPALLAGTAVASGIGLGALGQMNKRKPEQPEQKKAAGGLAKLLKGAKAAPAAKPAQIGNYQALPLQLPRAPNLPPQELTKTAERVARQQMGEHVRKVPNKSENLAGRSMKEVERLKNLDIELQPTKDIPTPTVVPEKKGEVRIGLPGDISIADQILMSVDNLPIGAQQEGGALYGFGKMDLPDPAFWASNRVPAQQVQNKATDVANVFDTPDVLAMHLAMGHEAMNFAQHFADANLRAIQQMPVHPESAKLFNEIVRAGNPKTGEKFPHFPGVENYEETYKALQQDPEMRKWFNNRMKVDKITGPLGLPSGKEIEYAVMEPALSNMEPSMVGLSVGRLRPGAELIPGSAHKTYSHDIPGLALGRTQELLPVDLAFPDAAAHIRKTKRPDDFTATIQKLYPHQIVDQQYIDQVGEYYNRLRQIRGYKKGGAVKKSGLSVLNKAII